MEFNLPFLTKDVKNTGTKKPIQEFVAQVKTGGMARSNRFAILFTPPASVNPGSLQKILLFCDQVQLPGVNFSTAQNRVYGEFRETPYEKLYEPINMSFYVDNSMAVKNLFDSWMEAIQDPLTRTFNYYNDYITNMVIEVQDINDNTRYEVVLWECYPKSVGAVQLDHAAKDVMKLSVNMQYKYFTTTPISQLANNQKIGTGAMDAFTKNFSGFQETINNTLGTRLGNFVTGSALTYGVTKLPGLLKF